MTLIKKILMDKKLKKLRLAAFNYRMDCEEWERPHYAIIIQDCDTWLAAEKDVFNWDEVMRLANTYWGECI